MNIAKILKDCPKGTKLYSPLCGECKLDTVTCESILVESTTFKTLHFNEDGTYYEGYDDAECLLFPSKENRDWSTFQRPFKAGDKDNGYKWNEETKTLEKLVELKFKVGDKIKSIISSSLYTVVDIKDKTYCIKNDVEKHPYPLSLISFSQENLYELVADKFDISILKPFDKVLVRNDKSCVWRCGLYSHYSVYPFHYICTDTGYKQCIPYENNEHLLGTSNDCDEYYKNW